MLPSPATSTKSSRDRRWSKDSTDWRLVSPSPYHDSSPSLNYNNGEWKSFLRQRARTTNLAVFLLGGLASISILINIRMGLGDAIFRPHKIQNRIPSSIQSTIPFYNTALENLIMIPGHAIWTGNEDNVERASEENEQWILQDIQKKGTIKTFIKHITKGVELAARDPSSLLIFSGGQTRPNIQASEAQSYLRYAHVADLFQQYIPSENPSNRPFPRATTEMFALDSFQNLLFSVARFREFTGHYPRHITVVGFGMKRKRFEDVHRAAMKWPDDRFTYIGIDDENEASLSDVLQFVCDRSCKDERKLFGRG